MERSEQLQREPMGSTIIAPAFSNAGRRQHYVMPPGLASSTSPDHLQEHQFKIRLANLPGIRNQASVLIKQRYSQRGYSVQELGKSCRVLTIVAYEGMNPVGTLSIGLDSTAGLLCEDLYRTEIDTLRAAGRQVCEFTKLATNSSSSSASVRTLASLFHVAFIHAHRIHRCDDVVLEINPQHLRFYKRALGLVQIGAERINRRVDAPAILMRGDFSFIAEQIEKFGGSSLLQNTEKSFYPHFFSPQEDQEILRRMKAMSEGQA